MTPALSGCVDRLRERSLLPPDALAVLAVGSLPRGWSHENSDCDLYVVSAAPFPVPGGRAKSVPLHVPRIGLAGFGTAERRYEVSYWLESQLEEVLAKVGWDAYESGAPMLLDPEEILLERLCTGTPVLGGPWLEGFRRRIRAGAFAAFLVTRSLAEADARVESALGMLGTGDLPSAVLAARAGLEHTVDALLDSHGVYGSRTAKWQARRVQDARLEALPFERYWAVQTMAGFDPDRPRDWVTGVLTLCKDLALEVSIR